MGVIQNHKQPLLITKSLLLDYFLSKNYERMIQGVNLDQKGMLFELHRKNNNAFLHADEIMN